jgi:hypothetical protein
VRPGPYAGIAAAATAMPLPYETSPGLPHRARPDAPVGPAERSRVAESPRRDTAAGSSPAVGPARPVGPAERSPVADAPRRRHAGPAPATAVLPAPGLRPDTTGESPRVGADDGRGGRSAVRALPDPDAEPGSRPGRSGGSARGARRRRGDDPAQAAQREPAMPPRQAMPPRPAVEPEAADRRSVRALRSVDSDQDASESTGIHYGFEDEPSLLLQWGAFILQTVLGAACGLGVWLGFYQLWERWPFYTAPAAGAAMAIMLAVTRSIRRRYDHDLDLLTAVLTVGVGVVLTVLPAAFVLQNV